MWSHKFVSIYPSVVKQCGIIYPDYDAKCEWPNYQGCDIPNMTGEIESKPSNRRPSQDFKTIACFVELRSSDFLLANFIWLMSTLHKLNLSWVRTFAVVYQQLSKINIWVPVCWQGCTWVVLRINSYIYSSLPVKLHSYLNVKCGLFEPYLKLWHGWITTFICLMQI